MSSSDEIKKPPASQSSSNYESTRALFEWLNDPSNRDLVVEAFVELSGKDKRKLRSKNHSSLDSIWGRVATRVLGHNTHHSRFFLYTVWLENKQNVQAKFDSLCGKRFVPPAEVEGKLFCLCEKRYEKRDPFSVNCFSCGNWYHCICIEMDPVEALNLSTYTCEYCTNKLAPPPNFEVPESEMLNFSFILMNEDGLVEEEEGPHVPSSSLNVKMEIEDDLLSIPDEETDEVLPMNDFTDSHLQEMHAFTELMKRMDECFEYPHDLPTIFDTKDFQTEVDVESGNTDEEVPSVDSNIKADSPKHTPKQADEVEQKTEVEEKTESASTSLGGNRTEDNSEEADMHKEQQKQKKRSKNKAQQEGDTEVQSSTECEAMVEPPVPEQFEVVIHREEWIKVTDYQIRKFSLPAVGKHPARDIESRDYSLKRDDYGVPLKKGFAEKNPYCLLHFGKKNVLPDYKTEKGAAQIRIYTNCTREGCTATWSFTCTKIPRDGDVTFLVKKTGGNVHHTNPDEKKSYQLRGTERKQEKAILEHEKAHTVRQRQKDDANLESMRSGNYAFVRSLAVLRLARSEKRHDDDLSNDVLVDLVLTKMKLDDELVGKNVEGYIQEIGLYPFKMILYVDESLEILHRLSSRDPSLTLIIDATDSLLSGLPSPLETKRPLLYTILVKNPDLEEADFPICEFTSTRHTYADVTYALLSFFETYKKNYNVHKQFYGIRRAEIDFSKTLLSSLINVFSKTSVAEYFTKFWEICLDRTLVHVAETLFPIHICRFHVLRFIKLYLMKCYPKSPNQANILSCWSKWAHSFVCGFDLWSMYRRMTDVFIIAGSYYYTSEVSDRIENIASPTQRRGDSPWLIFNYERPDTAAPFWKKSPYGQFSSLLHDQTEFYDKYLKLTGAASLTAMERAINPFYSEQLCNYFKVQIFPYYPILTRMVFSVFDLPIKDDTTNRCECHHSLMKCNVHKGNLRQRPSKFARKQCRWIKGSAKGIMAELTKYAKKPAAKASSTVEGHSASSREDRRSPEKYVETFRKPLKQSSIPKPVSTMKSARFLPHGGKVLIQGQEAKLYNTCNIDNVIMVLYLLFTYRPICHEFMEMNAKTDPISAHVVAMMKELRKGNSDGAKEIWVKDVLKITKDGIKKGILNLYEEERENGFRPIAHLMRLIRRNKCNTEDCPATLGSTDDRISSWDDVNNLAIDSSVRNLIEVYRSNAEDVLEVINSTISDKRMETVCNYCKTPSETTHYFPEGPPPMIFYALQGIGASNCDTDETIPKVQTIQGSKYDLFAVSVHTGAHIYACIYDDRDSFVYDGLRSGFIAQSSPEKRPVVGVWLVKSL